MSAPANSPSKQPIDRPAALFKAEIRLVQLRNQRKHGLIADYGHYTQLFKQ